MNTALYVVLGLIFIFVFYFLVAWGLSYLLFRLTKEKVTVVRNIRVAAIVSGMGLVSSILGMVMFSSLNSLLLVALLMCVLSVAVYFVSLKYLVKFTLFDSVILSIALAIILNPGWFLLLRGI